MTEPANRPNRMRFAGAGIELAGAVLVLALIGHGIDRYLNPTRPWGLLLGGLIGFAIGMGNLFRLAKKLNQ
ncbi:AtpZ/AtpI family protein [Candidatus Laterigemmans baculatus]|uniref:AtpZ/AtpI family protein n=1 Tax=Candidatus Laterigemmans baculatus TaxID=2770505 RepID=UPI0013DAE96C|nr:AtpZ/AtpI family protein [Candidatus Laterigemmans baculatus]